MLAAILIAFVVQGTSGGKSPQAAPTPVPAARAEALAPVPFQKVRLNDAFFAPRIETNRRATVEACLEQCEKTGRLKNFAVAAGLEPGKHEGFLYNDSDVYKVLEGVAYSLQSARDEALEARADEIIDWIAAAQRQDGYLNTYWQLVKPAEKWTNIRHGHELYCAGHLIEAAIAYEAATGKSKLLDVARKLAAHIEKEFGWGRHQEPTGHPELELALMKLWRRTGEQRWLDLATFFVDVRGRKDRKTELFGEYAQDHLPVREQKEVVGHAVRAMYLYSGMADVAAASGDRTLFEPLERIWNDLVLTKMYVTGGIGSSGSNEGFTRAYDLPNDSAYCETCAAIGMGLWNHRMFLLTRQTKYADVLEREVYNNVPAGVSLDGERFFYDNPLASRGDKRRVPWFDCSCCPSNLVRYLPGMGERVFATSGNELFVVLYAASRTEVELAGTRVAVAMETRYPYDGRVSISVDPAAPARFTLHLRIPDWCAASGVEPRLEALPGLRARRTVAGSDEFVIERDWKAGDVVELEFPMPPRRVHAAPQVEANVGRVAIARGPLIYCLEAVDNGGTARNLVLPPDAELSIEERADLLGGTTVVHAEGRRVELDTQRRRTTVPARLTFVPYCLWNNRPGEGPLGEMVVWTPESDALAELPGQGLRAEQGGVVLTASHCWNGDTLLALNDGKLPSASGDHSIPRLTFWDHRGTTEWIAMEFPEPRRVRAARVYWFDDTGRGSCRVPESWSLSYRDGDTWKPVALVPGASYGVGSNALQSVSFAEVETRELRIEVRLRKDVSAGVLEWQVE